jgi:hypothetical protein
MWCHCSLRVQRRVADSDKLSDQRYRNSSPLEKLQGNQTIHSLSCCGSPVGDAQMQGGELELFPSCHWPSGVVILFHGVGVSNSGEKEVQDCYHVPLILRLRPSHCTHKHAEKVQWLDFNGIQFLWGEVDQDTLPVSHLQCSPKFKWKMCISDNLILQTYSWGLRS